MTRKRLLSIIVGILVVGGLVISLNGDKQVSQEKEMIATATSNEARQCMKPLLKSLGDKAF